MNNRDAILILTKNALRCRDFLLTALKDSGPDEPGAQEAKATAAAIEGAVVTLAGAAGVMLEVLRRPLPADATAEERDLAESQRAELEQALATCNPPKPE